jgi:DNA-binding response OmpR family regulator
VTGKQLPVHYQIYAYFMKMSILIALSTITKPIDYKHSMKILIVDDNDLLQKRLVKALLNIDDGLDISQAYSYKQALELFTPSHPDKIILDIALPDGSGINLLKIFKEDDPGVKVIIFTNYPKDEFKKCCLELGADRFIDKKNYNHLIEIFK